jgi:excinuclease UvrABC nuclease subunit
MIKNLYQLPLEAITTPPGIYFLCHQSKLVYIGKAVNITNRIFGHISEGIKEFYSVFYIPCHVANLDQIESALIKYFRPKYNMSHSKAKTEADEKIFEIVCNSNLLNEDRAA